MSKLSDDEFSRRLEKCSENDFDGHTEFARLTPEHRLMWLSQAVQFYVEHVGLARHAQNPKEDSSQLPVES